MTASPQNMPSSKKDTMEAPDTVTNHCSYFPIDMDSNLKYAQFVWVFFFFFFILAVTLSEEVSHLIVVISSVM